MKNLIFVLGLFVYGFGFAQENNIYGTVLDGDFNNEPLAFAKITIKNTNQIVDSNINGNYVLNLKPGTYTLVYEFTGYEPIEVSNVEISKENINLKKVVLNVKKITFEKSIASKG